MVLTATAADKRVWQDGKTLSSERLERPCGEKSCVYQEFHIQGQTKEYTARETLVWRWSKAANVTVNGPVKFAVNQHERKLFVVDDDGKEHQMEVVSKALRQ
jgi:hypothetical protein